MSDKSENVVAWPAAASAANRLEQIRMEKAKIAAERESRAAAQAESEQLEEAERSLADERSIAAAEADHGPLGKKIALLYTDLGVVIVKRPNHLLYKRFLDAADASTSEVEKLVRPSVVHPDKATFDRYCEEQPAILVRAPGQVAALAGVKLKEVGVK